MYKKLALLSGVILFTSSFSTQATIRDDDPADPDGKTPQHIPNKADTHAAVKQLINTGGTLTKTGAGTLTLSGANTYVGTTTIKAGTLTIDSTDSKD